MEAIAEKPKTGSPVHELVDRLLAEILKQAPRGPIIPSAWLDQARTAINPAIGLVLDDFPLPAEARPGAEKLLQEMAHQLWDKVDQEMRPTPFQEKFWGAPTEADRQRLMFSRLKYKCLDILRRKRIEQKLFVSLDLLEDQWRETEEGGPKPQYRLPSVTEKLDARLLKEQLYKAILALPIQQAVIAYMMVGAQGNASKLARYLSMPQKQMSRHLAKIRKHFRRHGLEP